METNYPIQNFLFHLMDRSITRTFPWLVVTLFISIIFPNISFSIIFYVMLIGIIHGFYDLYRGIEIDSQYKDKTAFEELKEL